MLTFMNFFISSFSQLLSSPSFALMANKSLLDALNHCVTPSLSFDCQDDIQPPSVGVGSESHLRHGGLGSLLQESLRKSSSPKHHKISHSHFGFIPTPSAPTNSPALTPASSFPDTLCLNRDKASTVTSDDFPRVDSTYPSFIPSSSSTPTFDLSLTSDSSDCPDDESPDFQLFDSSSISSDYAILTPETVPKGVGLGIMGVSKDDGSGEFDGLGLVFIHRRTPPPSCVPYEANDNPFQLSEPFSQDMPEEPYLELSDTFRREAEMTFIRDPFHNHPLTTIPECQSASDSISDEFETSHALPALNNPEEPVPLRRTKKHFSASTISSELKRTSVSTSIRRMSLGGARARSSTWPSHSCSLRPHRAKSGDGYLRLDN